MLQFLLGWAVNHNHGELAKELLVLFQTGWQPMLGGLRGDNWCVPSAAKRPACPGCVYTCPLPAHSMVAPDAALGVCSGGARQLLRRAQPTSWPP
jgi:hypothetical protein